MKSIGKQFYSIIYYQGRSEKGFKKQITKKYALYPQIGRSYPQSSLRKGISIKLSLYLYLLLIVVVIVVGAVDNVDKWVKPAPILKSACG